MTYRLWKSAGFGFKIGENAAIAVLFQSVGLRSEQYVKVHDVHFDLLVVSVWV